MTDEADVREWYVREVKERIEDSGSDVYAIVKFCHFRPDYASRYFKGNPFPKLWNIILMAEYFGCSVNDLLGYEEVEDVNTYEKYLASKTYLGEDEFAIRFRNRLTRIMDEFCISAKDIHDYTEISMNAIESWICEKPEALPSVMQLIHICDALDCTPSDLLGY